MGSQGGACSLVMGNLLCSWTRRQSNLVGPHIYDMSKRCRLLKSTQSTDGLTRRSVICHFTCSSSFPVSQIQGHGSIIYRHVAIWASAISLLHSFSISKIDLPVSPNFVSQTSNSYNHHNFLLEIEKQCHQQIPSSC